MSFEAVPCVLRHQDGHPMYGLLIRPSQQTFIVQTGPNGSGSQVQLVPTNNSATLPPVSGNKLLLPPQNATFVQSGTSSGQQFATLLTSSGNSVLRTSGSAITVGQSKTLASNYPPTGALANNPVFIPASTVQQYQQNQRTNLGSSVGSEQVVPHSPGSETLGPASSNASALHDAGSPYGMHGSNLSVSLSSDPPFTHPSDSINAPEPYDLNTHHDFTSDDNPMFSQSISRNNLQQQNNSANELNSIFECLGARDLADLLSQSEAILSPDCGLLDDATVDATTAPNNSFPIPSHNQNQQQNFNSMDFSNTQPQRNQQTANQQTFDSLLQPSDNVVRAPCRYQSYLSSTTALRGAPAQQQSVQARLLLQNVQPTPVAPQQRQCTYEQSNHSTGLQLFPQLNSNSDISSPSMQAPGRLLMPNPKGILPQMSPQIDSSTGRSISRASSHFQANPPSASSYEPISDTEMIHLPTAKPNFDRKRHSSSSSSDHSPVSLRTLKKKKRKSMKNRGRFIRASAGHPRESKIDFADMPTLEAETAVAKIKPVQTGDSPGAATSTDSDGGASLVTVNNDTAQTSPLSPLLTSPPPGSHNFNVSQVVSAVSEKFDKTCMKVVLKEPEVTASQASTSKSLSKNCKQNTVESKPEEWKESRVVDNMGVVFNSADPNTMVDQIMKTLPPDQLQQFTKLFALKLGGSSNQLATKDPTMSKNIDSECVPMIESSTTGITQEDTNVHKQLGMDRVQDQPQGYLSDASSIASNEFRSSTKKAIESNTSSTFLADIKKRQMMLKLQAYRNKARNIVDPSLIETVLVLAGQLSSIKIEDFVSPQLLEAKRTCLELDWSALQERIYAKDDHPSVKAVVEVNTNTIDDTDSIDQSKFDNLQNIEAEADSDEDRSYSPELAPLVVAESPPMNLHGDPETPEIDHEPAINYVQESDCKSPECSGRSGSSFGGSPLVQIRENESRSISLKINLSKFRRSKRSLETQSEDEKWKSEQTSWQKSFDSAIDDNQTLSSDQPLKLDDELKEDAAKKRISECVLPPKKRIKNQQFSGDFPPPLTAVIESNPSTEMSHTLIPPVLESFAPIESGGDPRPPLRDDSRNEPLKMTIKTKSLMSNKKKKKRHSAYPWERKIKKSGQSTKFCDKLMNGLDCVRKKVCETINSSYKTTSSQPKIDTPVPMIKKRLPRKSSLKNGPVKECPGCLNMARFPPTANSNKEKLCIECLKLQSETCVSEKLNESFSTQSTSKRNTETDSSDLPLPKKQTPKNADCPKKRAKNCTTLPEFNPDNIPVIYLNSGGFKLPYDVWYEQKTTPKSVDPSITYKKIRTNVYVDRPRSKVSNPPVCSCQPPKSPDDVGCGEDCLNRKLYIECSSSWCPCQQTCSNQRFQKLHWASGLQKFDTRSGRGFGVKSTRPLAEGTFLCEYVGEVVSAARFADRMSTRYDSSEHHYALNLDSGFVIDAYTCGSIARFVNHSCQPNCEIQKWSVCGSSRMGVFSLRDIKPGEELTYNYKFHSFNARQKCLCGHEKCAGAIGSTSFKERGRKTEIARCSKQAAFFLPKPIALVQRCSLRPLSHRERVFSQKRRIFMLRNADRIRAYSNKKDIELESEPAENEKEFLQTQLTALKTSRSMSTRCLTKSTKNEGVTKIVQLAQVLHQIYILVLTSKDSYGSHFLPKLNAAPEKSRKKSSDSDLFETLSKLPKDFGMFGSYILSGAYQCLTHFERDMKKFLDPDAKSSRVVSKDLTILEGLQEQYSNAKKEYLQQLKDSLGFDIPDKFVPAKELVEPERPKSRLTATTTISSSPTPNTKDELLTTTADLSYLESSSSVPVGSYDPDVCHGLWPLQATQDDSLTDKARCSCGYQDENGLMVQCEACLYWQHTDCLDSKSLEVDPFYCDFCKVPKESLPLETFPVRDVLLVPQPNNKLRGCTYYRALLNPQKMQVRLSECVFVLKLINDDHKLALKRLHDECVEEGNHHTSNHKHKESKKCKLSDQSCPMFEKGMDTSKHFNRSDLRVFRVDRLFKDPRGQCFVFGFYYARPHETFCEPTRRFYNNELFCTPLYDTLPLDAVVGRCLVMDANTFCRGRPKWPLYREEDIFICELRVDKAQRLFEKMSTKSRSSLMIPPYLFRPFPEKLKIKREFTPFILPSETPTKLIGSHEPLTNRKSYSSDEDMPLVVIKQREVEANKKGTDKNQRLKELVRKILEKKNKGKF